MKRPFTVLRVETGADDLHKGSALYTEDQAGLMDDSYDDVSRFA